MSVEHVRKNLTVHAFDTNDHGRLALCGTRVDPKQRVRPVIPVTCGDCKRLVLGPRYAYCEAVTATATSRIHIRILTGRGLLTSGGADTPALCGYDVAWDIPGVVNRATLADPRTCPACERIFLDAPRSRYDTPV